MSALDKKNEQSSGAQVRAIAAQIIFAILYKQQTVDSLLPSAREKVTARDQALLTHLVQGTLRWYTALHQGVCGQLQTEIRVQDQIIYVLLALGLYQRAIMQQPDYVSANTIVEACKHLGKPKASGLVNAVLRKTFQALASGELVLRAGDQTHPSWLVDKIVDTVGDHAIAQDILTANDEHPPVWLRLNPHAQAETLAHLVEAEVELRQSAEIPTAFLLNNHIAVVTPLEVGGADVAVQDVSAQYLGVVLAQYTDQLPKNANILDACAAPGGKTALMAQQFPDWQITAVDKSAHRLERLRENLARQNLTVDVQQADLLDEEHDFFADHQADGGSYDLVVLDAPCSGIGVIRRHPDIKHLRVPKAIDRVATQQASILSNVWSTVRDGGYLVYITCSYLTMETDEIIQSFIAKRADVVGNAPLMQRKILPSMTMPLVGEHLDAPAMPEDQIDASTFPVAWMDGFFYAVLRKAK